MAKRFLTNIDLGATSRIIALAPDASGTDPSSGLKSGQIFYNTSEHSLKYYNGSSSAWQTLAAGGSTFTLGSTVVAIGGTTTTIAGLTLTAPTISLILNGSASVTVPSSTGSLALTSYVDSASANAYSAAQTYANSASSNAYNQAVSTAQSYSDSASLTAYNAGVTYANSASSNALSKANTYSDSASLSAYNSGVTYANSASLSAYNAGVTYANSASANAFSQAQTYADSASANALSQAQTYANSASSNALSQAQTYANSASTNALTQAQSAIATASSNTLSQANSYSDSASLNAYTTASAWVASKNYLTTESDTLQSVTDRGATTSNAITISSSTNSSGAGTGALIVSGGAGIGKDLYVGGNLNVSGSAFIGGSSMYISASNIVLHDSMIYLGEDNPSDLLDIGVVGSFTSGSYQHTGIVRDASDGIWKLFSGVTTEPTTVIDFSGATYDTLKVGAIQVSSSTVVTNLNASLLEGHAASYFAPVNSPTFTGTVNLGSNVATGSVSWANNSGNSVTTSQTNFASLTISGSNVATQVYVTSQGYVTSTGSVAYATAAGNADTVTNGVYTTGSYANPAWITSLAWSKISSTPTTLAGYGITDATKKYSTDLTGSNTSYTVTHNLNTRDVVVNVYDNATYDTVEVDVVRTDANTVTITFASAPSSNAYRAVVIG